MLVGRDKIGGAVVVVGVDVGFTEGLLPRFGSNVYLFIYLFVYLFICLFIKS